MNQWLVALEWMAYAVAVSLVLAWILGIRRLTVTGEGATKIVVNTTALWLTALIIVPVCQISPFHLIWIYPLSLGVSMLFPRSFIPTIGRGVASLALLGLDQENLRNRHERYKEGMLEGIRATRRPASLGSRRSVNRDRDVPIPDIGEAEDMEVIELCVEPGEVIDMDDPLIVIESDEMFMEVPSPFSGWLRDLKVTPGDLVNAGDVIATIAVKSDGQASEGPGPV